MLSCFWTIKCYLRCLLCPKPPSSLASQAVTLRRQIFARINTVRTVGRGNRHQRCRSRLSPENDEAVCESPPYLKSLSRAVNLDQPISKNLRTRFTKVYNNTAKLFEKTLQKDAPPLNEIRKETVYLLKESKTVQGQELRGQGFQVEGLCWTFLSWGSHTHRQPMRYGTVTKSNRKSSLSILGLLTIPNCEGSCQ